jgi:hypothetical protein
VQLRFSGEIIHWRGPAPFLFVEVPEEEAAAIHSIAREVTYGWGVIPATVTVGRTRFTTSLFPKDGGYLVGIKKAVQDAERIGVGDVIDVELDI